jgi:hypothetical protein
LPQQTFPLDLTHSHFVDSNILCTFAANSWLYENDFTALSVFDGYAGRGTTSTGGGAEGDGTRQQSFHEEIS